MHIKSAELQPFSAGIFPNPDPDERYGFDAGGLGVDDIDAGGLDAVGLDTGGLDTGGRDGAEEVCGKP